MNRAYISMGSNIEPERHLAAAVQRLTESCRLLAVSPVYETEPVGRTDQPNFLNAAILVETELGPAEFKDRVLDAIEKALGRERTADKNAPRTVDLDISLWNDEVLQLGQRHIPDPEICLYSHIARPLADIAPYYRHPENGQSLLEIADSLPEIGLMQRPELLLWPRNHADLRRVQCQP